VAAEAVSSQEFSRALAALDEGKQIEVDFAVWAIEDDPGWRENRYLAPAGSPYSGFIADITVDGYVIVYRVVDGGATVELWQLYEVPGSRASRPPRGAPFIG
jgi:hypothetical protein